MHVIDRNTTSVSPSNQFNPIVEFNSTEQSLEEELRDTVPAVGNFLPNEKDAQKNRERFAIKKSYSIEVSSTFISSTLLLLYYYILKCVKKYIPLFQG